MITIANRAFLSIPFLSDPQSVAKLLEANCLYLLDRGNAAQFAHYHVGHTAVDVHHGNSLSRNARLRFATTPAQGKVGDIDAMLSENCAHLSDNAGYVLIPHVDEVPLERRLNVNAVDVQQAWRVFPQYRAFDDVFCLLRLNGNGEHAARAAG